MSIVIFFGVGIFVLIVGCIISGVTIYHHWIHARKQEKIKS